MAFIMLKYADIYLLTYKEMTVFVKYYQNFYISYCCLLIFTVLTLPL